MTSEWWDAPFYEGSSRQYSTFVPHDVGGLIARIGGKREFTAWLDGLFDAGEYNHGNEPDILAPWLYIHAGRPDRTAERVRAIMAKSWYVWAAIGLFPNAGQPFYYLGSPIFRRSVIHLEHGRKFVIEAPDTSAANLYVQNAQLNGRPIERAWLRHDEVARGGTLVLQMGPRPSRWAKGAPPPPQVVSLQP